MDTGESNTELLETVRVERLSVSSEKPALDVSENAVKELLDNSCNFESVHEDWNSSPACPVLDNSQNAESDPLAEEPLTLDDTNCIPDSGDISFSAVENTDEMSWSTAVGNESTAAERMDSTHEQDTSSFLNITEKTNANGAETLDIGVAVGDQGGDEILTETVIDDGADVIHQQCLSNSTEVPAAVCDVQASATISSDNERSSQADSSLAEYTANGNFIFLYFLQCKPSQGSHASRKVLESSGILFPLSKAWKVLKINIGSGKCWKFDVKVQESS